MDKKSQGKERNQIRLKKSSILNVPFHKYEQDFTFIVNEQVYKTNRFIADLISKKISEYHLLDPTMSTFTIKTNTNGDFSKLIKLFNFEYQDFSNDDILFLNELGDLIDFDSYDIQFHSHDEEERTISNIIDKIKEHEKILFYSKERSKDIEFLASHFYELEDEMLNKIKEMNDDTIESIIKNPQLQLQSENQLLHLINELYRNDSKYSKLYEFVYFNNCSNELLKEFINIFDINDINYEIWQQISHRLSNDISENEKRYKNIEKKKQHQKYIEIPFKNNNDEFDGIINFLRKQINIKDSIRLTASSSNTGSVTDIIEYEDRNKYFYTESIENSWICIEFKTHQIIPTHYTIRTISNERFQKSWIIECSNDGSDWETIDKQTNCVHLKGYCDFHTFHIETNNDKPFKFFKMRQTGPDSCGGNFLAFDSIEIHGSLI